jgi:predicted enzyme related to lactoylglutathione lyase
MNLNQVTLPARDIAESVAFYRRLGAEAGIVQIVDAPHYARFECTDGGATFSLHRAEAPFASRGVVVYFEVRALDSMVAALQVAGISFTQLPRDEPWLWREARLRDPSGNELCLYWAGEDRRNPPWRLAATPSVKR